MKLPKLYQVYQVGDRQELVISAPQIGLGGDAVLGVDRQTGRCRIHKLEDWCLRSPTVVLEQHPEDVRMARAALARIYHASPELFDRLVEEVEHDPRLW